MYFESVIIPDRREYERRKKDLIDEFDLSAQGLYTIMMALKSEDKSAKLPARVTGFTDFEHDGRKVMFDLLSGDLKSAHSTSGLFVDGHWQNPPKKSYVRNVQTDERYNIETGYFMEYGDDIDRGLLEICSQNELPTTIDVEERELVTASLRQQLHINPVWGSKSCGAL